MSGYSAQLLALISLWFNAGSQHAAGWLQPHLAHLAHSIDTRLPTSTLLHDNITTLYLPCSTTHAAS